MSSLDDIVLLDPCNFTSLARTPWAGSRISQLYKKKWCAQQQRIGESWEFSCDPQMASHLLDDDMTLAELIHSNAKEALSGFQNHRTEGRCEILVKILNASSPLSLQVHPADGDPSLMGNECGKPESWYILDCEPGAGMYLGFTESISRRDFAKAIGSASTEDVKGLLNFVEVQPGDYFEIEPGVPHAIGPGVTLLEPQRVRSGQTGKTYRLWDWNRKYDAHGQESETGVERELHLEAGLRLIDPMKQVGESFVKSLRRTPLVSQPKPGMHLKSFTSGRDYQTHMLDCAEKMEFEIKIENGFASIVTLAGQWGSAKSSQTVQVGQPVFLPNAATPHACYSSEAMHMALITPAGSHLQIC